MKEVEDIKISIDDFSAGAGNIASRIIRSLSEGKIVNTSYVLTHDDKAVDGLSDSSRKLVLKAEQCDRIMARMLKENNDLNKTNQKISRSLPIGEKVETSTTDPYTKKNKRILVIKTTYTLVD